MILSWIRKPNLRGRRNAQGEIIIIPENLLHGSFGLINGVRIMGCVAASRSWFACSHLN